jgi:hypothetical protein
MDKVSILTASRVEPSVLAPRSQDIIFTHIAPSLDSAVRLQTVIGSISLNVLFQAYIAASLTLTAALWASHLFAVQAYFATLLSGKALRQLWNTRVVVSMRNKVFYEFAVFILGSGQGLILTLFWPGWWILGGATWALWTFCG